MSREFTVVAIIAAYNEADIIGQVVGHLVDQGVGVYMVDHGSTDGTVAEVEPYVGRGVVGIESFPAGGDTAGDQAGLFAWASILRRKEALAQELEASWLIHHDADEFRESPWAHMNLREAIRAVDTLGYNAIDFEVLNFRPTHDDFRRGQDVRDAFPFYQPAAAFDRVQVKCWKRQDRPVDLASTGGHEAVFPGRKVFPIRFLLRHYPIRGQAHGERKVFRERRDRFVRAERERGWHVQYDEIVEGQRFVWDASGLTRFDPDRARLQVALCHRGLESLARMSVACEQAAVEVRAALAHLEQEMEDRIRESQRLKADVEDRTRESEQLRRAVAARDEDLRDLREGIEGRIRAVEHLAGRVAALEGSRSWRWTAPLRALLRWLRGG